MPKILSNSVLYDSSPWYLIGKIINNPTENFITNALFTASSHFHCIKQLRVLEHYKENIAKC